MRSPMTLDPSQQRQLALAPPSVRTLIERLTSTEPATRLLGIESVVSFMLASSPRNEPTSTPTAFAAAAVPFLVELATHRKYPGGAALLARLTHVLAHVDQPPRSRAGASGTEAERDLYDRFEAGTGLLVRCGRTSRDPQANRLAACLAARFPSADREVEPLLLALLSGAPDPEVESSLLYMLTRVQLDRGGALSQRIAEALSQPVEDPRSFAVHLALIDSEIPLDGVNRRRAEEAIRAALARSVLPMDPRAYGRGLSERALEVALALSMK